MTPLLQWTVGTAPSGEPLLELVGEITGHFDFSQLPWPGPVVLDLARVTRINSMGAQWFIRFIDSLSPGGAVAVVRCPVAVVTHLNVLPALARRLHLRSFYVPFECPRCLSEEDHLVEVEEPGRQPVLPRLACARCGTGLELSDLEERYFAFLAV